MDHIVKTIPMDKQENSISSVKQTIESLIKAGTSFDINELEIIYHNQLEVLFIDSSGNVSTSNKETFKALFQSKKNNNDAPLNSWAHFNHISVNNNKAHVIITRKVNLTDKEDTLTLSIDLTWEQTRWQVKREVIFTH